MEILSLKLEHFRNYIDQQFTFDKFNIISGQNAQGKTNLLEAIYYLSRCKSFKSSQNSDIINFNSNYLKISAKIKSNDRDYNIDILLNKGLRPKISVNDVKKSKASDLNDIFKCISFCPDDLYIIHEGPSIRRKFLDDALCSLRPKYSLALSNYNKLIANKNKILENFDKKPEYLDILDDYSLRICHYGSFIMNYRQMFVKKLNQIINDIYKNLNKENIDIKYKTISPEPNLSRQDCEELLKQHYLSHKHIEIVKRTCISGVHKDDLLIYLDDIPTKNLASQGQTRSVSLCLKLSLCEIFKDDNGQYPVLLLDDILSELDESRQDFVLGKINNSQVFLSCCHSYKNISNIYKNTKIFTINNGKLI